MSTNHFSTEAPWLANHQHMMEPSSKPSSRNPKNPSLFSNSQICPHPLNFHNNPSLSLNLHHEDNHNNDTSNDDLVEEQFMPKEFLFEKPLTPSDVGKLNRLVIPKQHAEKYFPLNGNNNINNHKNNNDSNNININEKGLLLTFEDELGKSWRFRYSYWNSSQSYVLTKGWSRFVKEKKLDAGDIVLFESHRFDGHRFFIGWRRRGTPGIGGGGGGGGGGWNHTFYPHTSQSFQHQHLYQPECCLPAGSNVQDQTGLASSIGQPKTLRLFGVNMECHTDDVESEAVTPDGSTIASQGSAQYQYYHHQDQQYYYAKLNAYDHHNHME